MNSSEKKSANKLLTIGFILSFFFCISGLVVSIIGIVKAKKNNIKDITLGVVGIILSVLKLLFIPFVVLLIVNFDDYKEVITNKYNEATEACESGNAYGYGQEGQRTRSQKVGRRVQLHHACRRCDCQSPLR